MHPTITASLSQSFLEDTRHVVRMFIQVKRCVFCLIIECLIVNYSGVFNRCLFNQPLCWLAAISWCTGYAKMMGEYISFWGFYDTTQFNFWLIITGLNSVWIRWNGVFTSVGCSWRRLWGHRRPGTERRKSEWRRPATPGASSGSPTEDGGKTEDVC